MIPLLSGFSLYVFAMVFLIFEETLYFYYVLTTLTSLVLLIFFGLSNFYNSFEHINTLYSDVGCVIENLPEVGNRVIIYYPAQVTNK
jgi:hypothetical protein